MIAHIIWIVVVIAALSVMGLLYFVQGIELADVKRENELHRQEIDDLRAQLRDGGVH